MPKLLTHWIFAEDLLHRLPRSWRIRKAVDRNPCLYRYGAVAPDTPFYLLFGPGSTELYRKAEGFHEQGDWLERFLGSAGGSDGSAKGGQRLALVAGIFCHAAADAVFHPMVYHYSGFGTARARWRHHRIEGFVDLYFSGNFKRPEIRRLDEILRCLEVDVDTLIDWLTELFDLDRTRHRTALRRALQRNVLFLKLFINRPARLLAGWAAPAAPAGLKAYLAHFYPYPLPPPGRLFPQPIAYRNPATGLPVEKRIEEMGKEAVDNTLAVLERIEAGRRRIQDLLPAGWNLHTGIGALPKAAMSFFNTDRPLREIVGLP